MSYALALLFALSFLPQGLFYRHEYLPAVAILALWLLWRVVRSRARVSLRLYGGPALLLLGYLLSLLGALRPADTLMAVAELAVLSGLMLAAASERDPRVALRGMVAAALLAALYAFLVRGGFWYDPAAYTPPFLTGSIQYHNAFGAAIALGLLVGLALTADESRTWVQAIYACLGVPLMLGLFLSLSRGVYVLFPLALILLLSVLGPQARRRVLAAGLSSIVLGLALIAPVTAAADRHQVLLFAWVFVGMLAAGALSLLLQRLPLRLLGRRAFQAYAALIVLGGVGVSLVARTKVLHLLAHLAPAGVGTRAAAISLHSATLFDRLVMDGIAIRLILGHPFLGYGANAWQDLYHRLQTSYFIANETHSYVTQVFLEGGLLAGLGLLWLLWLLLQRLFKREEESGTRSLRLGAAVAGIFLLTHSAMDFDLSYFSLLAMFFYLVGVAVGGLEEASMRWPLSVRVWLYPLLLAALVIALPLGLGEKFYTDGLQAMHEGRFALATRELRQAAVFDPFDGRIPLAEAKILAPTAPSKAMAELQRAEALLPDDAAVLVAVMQEAAASDAYRLGTAAAVQALALEPLRADTYWYGAQILPEAALHALADHRSQEGLRDLQEARRLVQAYRRVAPSSLYVDLTTVPLPGNLPQVMDMAAGEEDALTGRMSAAEPLLWAAHQDPALRPHADIWLYAVAARLHSGHYLGLVAGQPWVLWRNINPDFVELQGILAKTRK